ncbi:MAG: Ppx/GppA phosphatase family protein [Cyclobacteriaceae bacterium]
MRLAVIDMGTNTFHLLIVDLEGDGFTVIYKEKIAVKIGKGGISTGRITEEASFRAIKALKRFREIIDEHQVDDIYATATSAIRNAINGKSLVALIERETGINTRIISGLEEATFIYDGVKRALDIGSTPVLIMDIGGGSIEFIIGTNEKILWKRSFEVGGQRLIDRFHKHDPINAFEEEALKDYLEGELSELKEVAAVFDIKTLIGSSGTFDTLSDIYRNRIGQVKDSKATEFPLGFEEFKLIVADLITKTRNQRLEVPGMIPLRADMIVVAVILVKYVTDLFNIEDIRVSAYALKEGVLLSTIDNVKSDSINSQEN